MLSVIIIDDEEWVRFLINGLVPWDKLGMRVVGEATNGSEGLELCRKLKPDIVLTDIRMPAMDGLALLERLKEESPEVKVVIISGYDEFSYAKKAVKSGAFDYVLKPVDEDELLEILKKTKEQIQKVKKEKDQVVKLKKEIVKLRNGLSETSEEEMLEIAAQVEHQAVQKALNYIHEAYNTDLTLENIAERVYMNANYFSELFKQETGKGFVEYVKEIRMKKAIELLALPKLKIAEIADMVGYGDSNYFAKVFRKHTGRTPCEYREAL